MSLSGLKIKETRLKKKVDFEPLEEGKVSMYVCGPTVYDRGHLGHGRSAVCFDVIRRYLIYKGFNVRFVSNYTDIDDKMINRAREEGITVPELAARVIPQYEEDYAALGVMEADEKPRATEYIDQMIEFVGRMDEAGVTYTIEGDGVYFDVKKAHEYGKLSGQKLEELKIGARVAENEAKRNPYDFVVWKFAKEGEPSWKAEFGDGRPGWHLECSAMSWKLLGEQFDIHGGGADLSFPHHECEIAQTEAVFGEGSFAKYWIHNGFITINKEKMSKSLGNFSTLRDLLGKYDGKVLRLMFLQTHYSNPIEFSEDLLEQAKAGLERIHDFVRNLKFDYEELDDGKIGEPYEAVYGKEIEILKKEFVRRMDDDFNTSGALGVLAKVVDLGYEAGNRDVKTKRFVDKMLEFLKEMDEVLGVIFADEVELDGKIEALIKAREEARASKDFEASDKIRDDLLKKGIELEDTPNGTIWKKV
jgi:cysteinyl-tRNA synthetase